MTIQDWINWHRTIGFIATVLVLILVVTGLALNHIQDLGLNEIYIENETLLDWYGIRPEKIPVSFTAGNHRVTQIDNRLYLDETEIADNSEELQGTIAQDDVIVLSFVNSVYLVTDKGELIEKVTALQGLPATLQSVGLGDGNKIIVRSAGKLLYSDINLQIWRPYAGKVLNWSVSEELPESMEKNLIRLYRGKGLSVERLVTDLHSGRILGKSGIYLVDISGIIFIILSGTGWWLWLKRRALQKEINGEL